jgi:hypothetical protein
MIFSISVDFLYAGEVPAAVEGSIEPKLDDFEGFLNRNHALAHRQDISVVVCPAQSGGTQVPAQGAANAFDPVSNHRLAVTRAAKQDSAVVFACRDGLCHRPHNIGVITRFFGIRAEIVNLVSLLDKELFYCLFVFETCLVCANSYLHQSFPFRLIYQADYYKANSPPAQKYFAAFILAC